jgi:hypothetical protein
VNNGLHARSINRMIRISGRSLSWINRWCGNGSDVIKMATVILTAQFSAILNGNISCPLHCP